jgi:hypothetical protein
VGEDFIRHVAVHQAEYLGVVYTVLRHWIKEGKPRTKEKRHAFTDWIQSMDWIVQIIFKKVPLIDNHFVAVLNDKYTGWLRTILLAMRQMKISLPVVYQAHQFREICETKTIPIPGTNDNMDTMLLNQKVGTCLGKIFENGDNVRIEGYSITRHILTMPGSKH